MTIGGIFAQEEQEHEKRRACQKQKRRANLELLLNFGAIVPEAILSAGIEDIS